LASKKSVVQPNYSGVLLQRGRFWSSDPQVGVECIEALAEHYKVGVDLNNVFGPRPKFMDPSKSLQNQALDWMSLAVRLASDIVPAFRQLRKGGRPKRKRSDLGFRYAHEARLVQLTLACQQTLKAQDLPSRRTDAFRVLVKLRLGKSYPSWRFATLAKASSFAQAWKQIPKQVRDNPTKYLPEADQAAAPPTFEQAASALGGLYGLGNWLLEMERQKLAEILPPLRLVAKQPERSTTN
jgi:hypothetical protein